ncbi:MAG: flavodoxin family protein [Clostridiales bacterium]|jgi:multimeric flavodoxin WrbA|nr:flavodoxin family protein [Clostridiales bacterium]
MKVIAINGSPKQKGNTYIALKLVCDELEKKGIETEIINIGNRNIKGCVACGGCKDGQCIFNDEKLRGIINNIFSADGILLGSPVYYSGISGTMKSFLDRLFYASHGRMRLKIGAALAVSRRSGEVAVFDQLNHYFLISEMLVAPSYYWNVIHGGSPGEVLQDQEGITTLKNLANNMAWMLQIKDYSKETHPEPEAYPRVWTNFIR